VKLGKPVTNSFAQFAVSVGPEAAHIYQLAANRLGLILSSAKRE